MPTGLVGNAIHMRNDHRIRAHGPETNRYKHDSATPGLTRRHVMIRSMFRRRAPKAEIVVTAEGVSRQIAADKVESVRWDDLIEVRILTTDDGPRREDVFFVLAGTHDTGVVVPQGDLPASLLERLQQLPAFDNTKLIEAMGSTENAEFVCWTRPTS